MRSPRVENFKNTSKIPQDYIPEWEKQKNSRRIDFSEEDFLGKGKSFLETF